MKKSEWKFSLSSDRVEENPFTELDKSAKIVVSSDEEISQEDARKAAKQLMDMLGFKLKGD